MKPICHLLAISLLFALLSACNDEVAQTEGACEDHSACDEDQFCDDVSGVCADQRCVPGSSRCENGGVARCNDLGSDYLDPVACQTGVCTGGQCGCSSEGDCAPGEDCAAGQCVCPSAVSCGDSGTCCGDGESCDQIEICDDDDDTCETLFLCRPACQGSVCGLTGDLCCEGDTPECGPTGQCAPSCEGGGDLCGENFDICCPAGDICVFSQCRTPGNACQDFTDCGWGEYCDRGIGRCMSDDFPDDIQCFLDGDFLELEVVEKWSWTDEDIISIPVVGDVTGDGQPNVVINTSRVESTSWNVGEIVILDSSGNQLHRIPHNPVDGQWGSFGRSNIALADVTGNGVMDIIYMGRQESGQSRVVAIDGSGELLWLSHDASGDPVRFSIGNGAITVANFDDDPTRAEIVVGASLITSEGLVVWNEGGNGPDFGSNAGYHGGVALVADLTGDGNNNIITGRHAWTVDWQPGPTPDDPPQVSVESLWAADGPDGYPAIGDFNGNGLPEVVLVASGTVRIIDGTSGKPFCSVDPTGDACLDDPSLYLEPIALPGPTTQNRGGPPTVADFDNDGRPEIGVAGGHYYAVFDLNRSSFAGDQTPEQIDPNLLEEFDLDPPDEGALFIRWMRETRDLSSNTTGSSVFDFQGDGAASVVYSDECYMRVYSGIDGQEELKIPNSTGTILEYPIVVDVDADGRSDILVVSSFINHCEGIDPDYQPRRGLYVFEDPNDRWVRTRSIWNQHAYSIDNILDDGSLPLVQPNTWQTHNTYRNNRQGEVPLHAPDVVVSSVQTHALSCPPNIELQATITNMGMSAIPSGLPVSLFYADDTTPLQTVSINQPISPGGTVIAHFSYEVPSSQMNQDLYFLVMANDDGSSSPLVQDCNPDTATALVEPVQCRIPL